VSEKLLACTLFTGMAVLCFILGSSHSSPALQNLSQRAGINL
jgi:hypothetical protein